ncbi:MAG TPA: helix-turn-helix domain-containing protein [Tepidisphaeraceae bacterium]|nr:helix-turn-helix domain-containing protein [Tepidisphaeraceae bacterium]
MTIATDNNILADGLYTVDQAAHLARLSPRSLRRWLDGEGEKEAAVDRRFPSNELNALSFVDLVQALAIRSIRNAGTLSLQKIRLAIQEANKFGITYPFARQHTTFLFRDDIVIDVAGQLIQITGQYRRQQLIRPVVELYLKDLTFDPESGLASEWVPLRDAKDDRRIVIKPTLQYGAPVVMNCGYTVNSLVTAVDSEGSPKAAADMYDVPEDDVIFALRYEDMLAGTAA